MTEKEKSSNDVRPPGPEASGGDHLSQIGPYRILDILGEGGMSVVYLAEQSEPVKRRVALKILKPGMDSKQVVARFESERQALAVLDHPNIAKIFDGGIAESGHPYFVMEQVKGVPITDYCDDQRLNNEERLKVFIKVCSAVQHSHLKGLIHRDLKPSNILVGVVDGEPQPKIIDFGIAKATSTTLTEATLYTRVGQIIGTPQYMSPEQANLTGLDIDTRADIYSLGVVLYELLVGTVPLDLRAIGDHAMQVAIREKEPSKPSTRFTELGDTQEEIAKVRGTDPDHLRQQLKGDLDWIIMRAIEKDRTRRYETANALAMECRRFLKHEPVLARPPSPGYLLQRFVRRNRLIVAAGSIAILAVIAGAALATLGFLRATEAELIARQEAETASRVSDFLTELFEVSDPSEARGNTMLAREIMDQGADRIEQELATQPNIQATLMDTMGSVYKSLGLYPEAAKLLNGALVRRRELLGAEHADVALTKAHLAQVLTLQASYDAAEPMYQEALDTQRRVLGDESSEVADTLVGFSMLLTNEGRYEEAEVLLSESLEVRRSILGEEHLDVAKVMEDLGMNLFDQGNYGAAKAMLRDSNAMRRRLLNGSPHPQLADGLNNLGLVLWTESRFGEAEVLFREALDMNHVLLDEYHPTIAVNMNNLALLLHDAGDFEAAEPMYRDVISARRQTLGDEHPEVALALSNLAYLLYDKNDRENAMTMQREAIDKYRELFPEGHPDLASSLGALGGWLTAAGNYGEAEALINESVDMRKEIFGDEHIEVANGMTTLARLYLAIGRFEEAENLSRTARQIFTTKLSEDHWRTAVAASVEGSSLAHLQKFEAAEKLLLDSHAALKKGPGSGSRTVLIERAAGYLADLYRDWGKLEEAVKYQP